MWFAVARVQTDKASLLAEVLEHVKELKRQTSAMTMMAAAAVGGDEDDDGGPVQMLPTDRKSVV